MEGGFSYLTDSGGFSHPQPNELKPYYILLEGYRARPPGPEPQLEDSYTGRLLTSRRDTIAYGTIPCIDLRKEDLDGPSSLVRMCVKID